MESNPGSAMPEFAEPGSAKTTVTTTMTVMNQQNLRQRPTAQPTRSQSTEQSSTDPIKTTTTTRRRRKASWVQDLEDRISADEARQEQHKADISSTSFAVGGLMCRFYLVVGLLGGLVIAAGIYVVQPSVIMRNFRSLPVLTIRGYYPTGVSPKQDLPIVARTWAICTAANQRTRDVLHYIRQTQMRLSYYQRQKILWQVLEEEDEQEMVAARQDGWDKGYKPDTESSESVRSSRRKRKEYYQQQHQERLQRQQHNAVALLCHGDVVCLNTYRWWSTKEQRREQAQDRPIQVLQSTNDKLHLYVSLLCWLRDRHMTQRNGWNMDFDIVWKDSWPVGQNLVFFRQQLDGTNVRRAYLPMLLVAKIDKEATSNGEPLQTKQSAVPQRLYEWMVEIANQDQQQETEQLWEAAEGQLYDFVESEKEDWVIGRHICATDRPGMDLDLWR